MAEMIFHPIDLVIGFIVGPILSVLGFITGVVLEVLIDSSNASLPSNISGFASFFALIFALLGMVLGLAIGIYASMHYRGATSTLTAQSPK